MSSLSSLHSTLKRRSALLPRLLTLEVKLESTLNGIYPTQDIDEAILELQSPQDSQEEDEDEDVEYNEELDDAGLIEDGEDDYDDSEEDEDEESLNELPEMS